MKYLHLLLHDEIKFSEKLFRMLNDENLGFNNAEQWFITPYEEVYNELRKYGDNISFHPESNINLINKYGKQAEWVFVHALNLRKYQVIQIRKNIAKKVIWRVWGHDILEKPAEKGIVENIAKTVLDKLYINKVRQFYGIGTGFKYDNILICERFGNVRTFPLSYTYQKGLEKVYKEISNKCLRNTSEVRIMIGHSGNRIMNHIDILKSLKHLSGKSIKIVLILSYGKDEYIRNVKEFAYKNFSNEELEVVEDFLPIEKYLEVLNSIDVAVFDQVGSAALGNLTPLLYFNKKFVFNKNGLMGKVFDIEGLEYIRSDDLANITLEELAKRLKTQDMERKLVENRIKDNYVPNTWKKLFSDLSQLGGQ